MTEPVSVVVKHEGTTLGLRFPACRVALGGEFAGNVDVDVDCEAGALDAVVEHLSVQLPGAPPSGPALGHGPRRGGAEVAFWSEPAARLQQLPEQVALEADRGKRRACDDDAREGARGQIDAFGEDTAQDGGEHRGAWVLCERADPGDPLGLAHARCLLQ